MKTKMWLTIAASLMFAPSLLFAQQIISSECIGTPETEVPNDIQPTADGGFIIVGFCMPVEGIVSPTSHGGLDFYVAKLNSLGQMEWQNNYGGSHDEIAYGIAELPSGEFVITGKSFSDDGDITDHHGSVLTSDIWCIQISSTGSLVWSKSFGTIGNDSGSDILYKNPNKLVLGGTVKGLDSGVAEAPYNSDIWIAILDLNGNVLTDQVYGDTLKQELNDILRTNSDEYYLSGTTYLDPEYEGDGSAMIMKIDEFSNLAWTVTLPSDGNNGIGNAGKLCQDEDGNIIMGFQTSINNDNTNCNPHGSFHFVSVSENGDINEQACYGGSGTDISVASCMTSDGKIWVIGSSNSSDGDVDGLNFTNDQGNIWLARLNQDLEIEWTTTLGGEAIDGAVDICVQGGSTLYILGYTNSLSGIVEGLHNQYGNYFDNWVVKIDTQVLGMEEPDMTVAKFYPNPFQETLTIQSHNQHEKFVYRLFDQMGKLVEEGLTSIGVTNVELGNIQSGVYQLQLSDSSGRIRSSGRVVKS